MDYFMIGDVHLGKKFRSKDIPMEKRGIREEILKKRFEQYIDLAIKTNKEHRYKGVVLLGDLFDSFCVSYEDLVYAQKVLSKFEENFIQCYILAGNHDVSKDSLRISAFSLLEELMSNCKYIKFVSGTPVSHISGNTHYIFIPYVHGVTYEEQLKPFVDKNFHTVVFGHFEEPYTDWLKSNFDEIYTGHVHLPRKEDNVTVVGSIMPFTFAEDANNQFMKTCTLEEYQTDVNNKTSEFRCYRIKLKDGEELPAEKHCLQMSIYKEKDQEVEDNNLEVAFETFDIETLMHEALDDLGLFEEIYKVYSEYKMAEVIA